MNAAQKLGNKALDGCGGQHALVGFDKGLFL